MSGETHTAATWGELVTLIPRLRAAEKVIHEARKTLWECGGTSDDGWCINHWHKTPCPVALLADSIADYDKEIGQ